MISQVPSGRRPRDGALAIVLLGALLLAAWLDRGRVVHADQATVFAAIWAGIQIVASWLGTAGAAIATSLEGVVSYLVSAVAWLGGRVADILTSTGAMFARVWDGLRVVWTSVLKPMLLWVDQQLTRLQTWLKSTFKPVFDFLRRVRDELNAIYTRFVRPVVDTIEFIRQLNRVLLTFHITFLQKLDATLEQIEQRIEEPILWLNRKLSELQNAVNFIVTADGLFQRLTLLHSMNRYAPAWISNFWTKQLRAPDGTNAPPVNADAYPVRPVASDAQALNDYFESGSGEKAAVLDELGLVFVKAAGG